MRQSNRDRKFTRECVHIALQRVSYSKRLPCGRFNTVAEFSSRGPTFDGRVKPEIMAPGQDIVSAYSDGNPTSNQCGLAAPVFGEENGAARLANAGTSMAAPITAGSAALVREYYRRVSILGFF